MSLAEGNAELKYLVRLLGERVHKYPQQFICVVDLVGILANNPNQGRFRFWLIQLFQISAKCRDYTFVRRRVLPEDILKGMSL